MSVDHGPVVQSTVVPIATRPADESFTVLDLAVVRSTAAAEGYTEVDFNEGSNVVSFSPGRCASDEDCACRIVSVNVHCTSGTVCSIPCPFIAYQP